LFAGKVTGNALAGLIFQFFSFSILTPMKNDPTFRYVRFPCYLTERQLALLKEIARERREAVTELVREAVHYWLKALGRSDAQFYSTEEVAEAVAMQQREQEREWLQSRTNRGENKVNDHGPEQNSS
jgi:hypothetical protein